VKSLIFLILSEFYLKILPRYDFLITRFMTTTAQHFADRQYFELQWVTVQTELVEKKDM